MNCALNLQDQNEEDCLHALKEPDFSGNWEISLRGLIHSADE